MSFKGIAVPPRGDRSGRRVPKPEFAPSEDFVPSVVARGSIRSTALNPTHRYAVGDMLFMARGGRDIARQASACQVVSLLPHEGGPLRYRVRSEAEGFERIVDETDLTTLSPGLE